MPFDLVRIELGLAFEQELEDLLIQATENTRVRMAERLLGERPGEFEAPHADWCSEQDREVGPLDPCPLCGAGLLFSPDYLFTIGKELVLGEFKMTWMSGKGAPTDQKFNKWITQMALYCYWLGITKARLYAYFVNHEADRSPRIRAWEFSFTRKELADEAKLILRFAQKKGLLKAA